MDDSKCDLLHEILNRLTVVIGQCDLIQETTSNQDPACNEEANRRLLAIKTSANKMADLILKHRCPAGHRSEAVQIQTAPLRNPPLENIGVRTFANLRRWLNE